MARHDSPYNQATTESYTEDILDSYDNAGYSDAIWGYVVNHEFYEAGNSPYWKKLGWVVDKIASEKPGKAIIAVGDLSGYGQVDTFLEKLWASVDGLMITERYVWRTGKSIHLTYFTYQAYAHSNNLPGSWSLDSISSGDPSNPLNILEVRHWTGPDGEDVYALCNRDPDNTKNITANFDSTYAVYHDDISKGSLSSYQFTLGKGDVAVLRLE